MFRATVLAVPIIAAAATLLVPGCRSSLHENMPQHAAKTHAEQQLIIKFKAANAERLVCNPDGIARLAAAAGVSLQFLRVMSGDACVIRQEASNATELIRGQARIKRHPAVEWVEEDAIMKTQ